MISIVLVQPETSGNIGAIARVMANFNFKSLILINPKCDHLDEEAIRRSKHAKSILKQAKTIKSLKQVKADYLIATSAIDASDYNLKRTYLTPNQLTKEINKKASYAIVFGRESDGLSKEEINMCDFSVKIPANKSYPVLNISHAVGILLYQLYTNKEQLNYQPINNETKQQLLKNINKALDRTIFPTDSKKLTQKTLWKNIIGKSMLSKREAVAMMGFFSKVNHPKQSKKK